MENGIYEQIVRILKNTAANKVDKVFYREQTYYDADQNYREVSIEKSDDLYIRICLEKRYGKNNYSLSVRGTLGDYEMREIPTLKSQEINYLMNQVKDKCDGKLLFDLQGF